MPLKLSRFGERFTRATGALELMDDLGNALAAQSGPLMLGGGNPGKIEAVQRAFRRRLAEVAASERQFDRLLCDYAHPRGELGFRRALARLLRDEYGWRVDENNIALTGGSQSAFFMLFNLFAGDASDGSSRRVLLPVTPEYVGYADVGLGERLFTARRPAIELLDAPYFKYRLDVPSLDIGPEIGAVCVSRPTNPTGNVLTDAEMARLDTACRESGVPLIVDGAYGPPFPNIVFAEALPVWNENTVYCMSLSKLGIPAARTGIVVASTEIVGALTSMTAVLSLAVGSVGPVLAEPLVESGAILGLCREHIVPYYRAKALHACERLARALRDVPFRIHKPEGAFFLWLWLPETPMPSAALYERLKAAGVFVLSGHHFFPGLEDDAWPHRNQCLRISFAQDEAVVERGIELLAAEICRVHAAA